MLLMSKFDIDWNLTENTKLTVYESAVKNSISDVVLLRIDYSKTYG